VASVSSKDLKWYIVNVQTSCEAIAKTAITERINSQGMQDLFGEILIPAETVMELVKGKKATRSKKFFPGYIFVQMVMNEKTWHLVKNSAKVTGFIGGSTPKAVTDAEVQKVTQQMATGAEKPKAKASFSIGDSVVVVDGPFSNFNGTVEEINEEKAKVKVSVSIFGRPTPVELDFIQVDKT
jgi:transcriptional antiterminator NusG